MDPIIFKYANEYKRYKEYGRYESYDRFLKNMRVQFGREGYDKYQGMTGIRGMTVTR